MNMQRLKSIIKSKANEYETSAQELYDTYFFEQLLKRLSKTDYVDQYVLKGGFLLENLFGVRHRSTLDLDFSYRKLSIDKDRLCSEFSEIVNVDVNDGIVFSLIDVNEIIVQSKSNGFRIRILAKLDRLSKIFSVDIAAGDYITPKPTKYEYYSQIINGGVFTICAYNIETILSEKFETLISKGTNNTRMKDFYDIHILINSSNLSHEIFREALYNTFHNKGTNYDIAYILKKVDEVLSSEIIINRFDTYKKVNRFSTNLDFSDVCQSVHLLVSIISSQSNRNLCKI